YKNWGKEPPFKNMCKIADALDVSLDVFRERR
ncbi:XRE family transcriptional regulator, partial [Limosilactobacillus reuteri]|nr:XRE family transcriptional regulator [Limosilactobacillus reuteri]MCT3197326.1 XRE family transcriptional regulator [Limosilactobacillus reuteri]